MDYDKNGYEQQAFQRDAFESQSIPNNALTQSDYKVFVDEGRATKHFFMILLFVVFVVYLIITSPLSSAENLEDSLLNWMIIAIVALFVILALKDSFILARLLLLSKPSVELGPEGLLIRKFKPAIIPWSDIIGIRLKEELEDSLKGKVGAAVRLDPRGAGIREIKKGIILDIKETSTFPDKARDSFSKNTVYLIPATLIGDDITKVAKTIDRYRLEYSTSRA